MDDIQDKTLDGWHTKARDYFNAINLRIIINMTSAYAHLSFDPAT